MNTCIEFELPLRRRYAASGKVGSTSFHMHAVIVDGDVSYPPTSGKRLRTLHLMLRLAERHRITYIGRIQDRNADVQKAADFLRDHKIEPILVDDPLPRKKGPLFLGRLAANLASGRPYSVTSHQSAAMRRTIQEYASKNQVDLWQVEWSAYLPALEGIQGPRLLVAHNVDTLIWQRYYENAGGFAKRLFLKQQWHKFEKFERWAFKESNRVVTVSAEDAALIRERFGQPKVDVVDNGIDRDYFEGVTGRRDPRRILFLGALDWRPNQDAVALLLDKIFPQVLAQKPDAKLVLVGRNPPQSLAQRVAGMKQVELDADVPDVRPFLAQAGVMTVPLRIGGGSRLKILEALACGLPVVSSKVGAEGLCLRAGEHFVQADEEAMAQALVQAIRAPEMHLAQACEARRLVLDTYDWAVLAKKLEAVWEKTCRREVAS
jgi:glycosyltransferase involved in cell wall biosynthesis